MNSSRGVMCYLLLALALAACASAQVSITISPPQPSRISGLDERRAIISNGADTPMQVYGMTVYEAAVKAGVNWVGDVGLALYVQQSSKRGIWYVAGLLCEVGGYAGSVALVGRLATIKERVAVAFPIGASACSIGRMLYNRERIKVEVPRDLLPPLLTVPAHSRVDYAIWGR